MTAFSIVRGESPVKNSTRFCIITLVLSMLLAFVIFTLFANGILVLHTSSRIFDLMIAFSCILLSALLLGALSGNHGRLHPFSCCGSLAAAGGGCLAITAFLTSLSTAFSGIVFSIGIALCFFFLSLFAGGIFCLLHGLFSQEQEKGSRQEENTVRPLSRSAPSDSFSPRGRLGANGSSDSISTRSAFRRGYEERDSQEENTYGRRPLL